jgi:hypothetical protein
LYHGLAFVLQQGPHQIVRPEGPGLDGRGQRFSPAAPFALSNILSFAAAALLLFA